MATIIQWLENHLLTCPYKAWAGINCPGCGIQRSFVELLKGNLIMSIQLYPALLPVLFTLFFTGLHLIFNFKNGATLVKYSFICTSIIIALSYLCKTL